MPSHVYETRRARAIRAALAVTLAGVSACGSEPTDEPRDATSDSSSDAENDVVADATDTIENDAEVDAPDVSADTSVCSTVIDQTCPATCTELTDADCCDTHCGGPGWGFLSNGSCNCAVEGPFAPPSFGERRVLRRALPANEVA